ncbi:MAG: GtrA family protein [Halobacteria archaeon]|nr:GtrA family protein [Halobacteria archaeon]
MSRVTDILAPPRGRVLKFFVVGVFAAGVQTLLLWGFVEALGMYYVAAAVVAIEITIVLQYVINNAWTFKVVRHTDRGEYIRGLVRTNAVRGSAIPIQVGILYALVTWGGLGSWGDLGYIVANGVGILISGVYRYVLDARWTWQIANQ